LSNAKDRNLIYTSTPIRAIMACEMIILLSSFHFGIRQHSGYHAGFLLRTLFPLTSWTKARRTAYWVRRGVGWVPISLPSLPKLRQKNTLGP
jgi:hypothetical protein